MFIFSVGNTIVSIGFWNVCSLIICIATHLICKKFISSVKREVAIPILILNWIGMISVFVCEINYSIICLAYNNIRVLLTIIILIPWHIVNIIKLNKRKNISQTKSIIYCNACGTALEENTAFCTKCGNQTNNR